jgi:hypothetical protein
VKIYMGAVSSETQNVGSLTSLYDMQRRPGDELFIEYRTRGDVARESLLENFRKRPEFDAYLALDADQRNKPDMLERLRTDMETHNLDMVCAHYYRRETKLIQSLCYPIGDGTYPFLPYLNPPREGFHELAWTGLGCVLIHRRVIEAVWATLPAGQTPFAIGTLPSEANDHANWGSDVRFFLMARRLGFKLWLDAGIESLHAVTLWLGHKSADKLIGYQEWADAAHPLWEERVKLHGMNIEAINQRVRILEARRLGLFQQAEPLKGKEDKIPELQQVTVAIYEMDGRLKECMAWLDVLQKYPRITKPEDLPTTETMPAQDHSAEGTTPDEIAQVRGEMYRENAAEIVDALPELKGNGRR